jgi:hypothetical protein
MRAYLFLPSVILSAVLLYNPAQVASGADATSLVTHDDQATPHEGRIIKVTDRGIEPLELTVDTTDSVVFFFNDTADSLITLTLQTNGRKAHCASANLKIEEQGGVHSIAPIVPKDFASTCFQSAGRYPFTVSGLKGNPEGIQGAIVVR